jgi:hypothetical protein
VPLKDEGLAALLCHYSRHLARLSFQPELPLVRHCIEWLLDKEYLARHASERDVYLYVA